MNLLHHLNSAGGTVGVGGNNDSHTVGLLHLLTGHVEVAYVSNSLATVHLVDAGGIGRSVNQHRW